MGALACRAVLDGKSGLMAGMMRKSTAPSEVEDVLVPIEDVMLTERTMPKEFISEDGMDVTEAFCDWCRPLIGAEMPRFADFKGEFDPKGVKLH